MPPTPSHKQITAGVQSAFRGEFDEVEWPEEFNALMDEVCRRIGPSIFRTLAARSWTGLIPRTKWSGSTESVQTSETDEETPSDVPGGHTVRSYGITQRVFESEDLTADSSAYDVVRVLSGIRDALCDAWSQRGLTDYTDMAEFKVVLAEDRAHSAGDFPPLPPTSPLSQEDLAWVHGYLTANGAAPFCETERVPQFLIVTDVETSDALGFVEPAVGDLVPEELKHLGVRVGKRGFYANVTSVPRRWDLEAGNWIERHVYETHDTPEGLRTFLSQKYIDAPYTDTVVFLPSVMQFAIPDENPKTYVGDIRWINTTEGQTQYRMIRAHLMCAAKPLHPEHGFVIRHLRYNLTAQ